MTERRPGTFGVGRGDLIASLCLVAVGLAVFAPALAGNAPLLRDFPGFTLPSRQIWQQSWSDYRIPEWNPFVGLGLPILAAPVHGAFYPGHMPLLLGHVAAVLPVLFVLHAIGAGLGALVLARVLGCGPVASFVGAAPWVIGGYAVSMWQNGEKVLSSAWIPWAIACLVQASKARAATAWSVAAAVTLALVALAGDPFLWLDTLALGLPLAAAAARARYPWPRAIAVAAGRAATAGGLGLLLAAPALLPAWLLRIDTERARPLAAAVADAWSLHPLRLLELVAPGAFGDPTRLDQYPGARFADDPTLQALPWAVSIYGGAACTLFPILAGRKRTALALAGAGALGLLAALGRHTPVYPILRTVVFPLGWTRYPEKHIYVALAALSLLGALGCERLLAGATKLRGGVAVFAVLALTAAAIAPADLRPLVARGLGHSALTVLLLAGAVFVARRHPGLAPLVAAVTVVDLGAGSLPLLDWVDASALVAPPPLARAVQQANRGEPPRIYRPRGDHLRVETLPENAPSLFGIGTYPGHDPAKSARLHVLASGLGSRDPRLGQLLGLDFALVPGGEDPPEWTLLALPVSPRAWLVGSVTVADDALAIASMRDPAFDPGRHAMVAPTSGARALTTRPTGDCMATRPGNEHFGVRCRADQAALLVVSEGWGEGWTAEIDGTKTSILRADIALRGVYLEPGSHDVSFVYRTPGLAAGLGLSAAGLAVTAILLGLSARRRLRGASGGGAE
jgi:hypothetical protein